MHSTASPRFVVLGATLCREFDGIKGREGPQNEVSGGEGGTGIYTDCDVMG